MPKMMALEINPDFKAGKGQAESLKQLKATFKSKSLPEVTAMENVRNSQGMLRVKVAAPVTAPVVTQLEDMPDNQLKLMMLSAGILPEGKVTRDEVIALLRAKMDEIDFGEKAAN
ncbi:MAG: hypothetical protein Unbinned5081contig1001_4 [Prokaryotic dsDNA virus sp.]|nr:MAG: hypothetical protein Unbinned5081contig1001_4 [Prokaryotic dsDNA virus sp.]|tara:strand:+ start:738 stop:1082 length:345 start_codon:yes stop_codon:yes gene_type:complete